MTLRRLLDGSQIDDEDLLSTVPRVLTVDYPRLAHSRRGDVYDASFGGGSLPSWLSYNADDGSTSPTLDGIGSSTVSLSVGSGSVSALQTGPINFGDFSGVHVYADFDSFTDTGYVVLGDDKGPGIANGFKCESVSETGVFQRVVVDGTDQQTASQRINGPNPVAKAPTTFGFSIEQGPGTNGHNVRFFGGGQLSDEWIESNGFPAAQDYQISVGAKGGSAVLDRLLVILVP